MSTYQGDERRDQTERGKELRRLVGLAIEENRQLNGAGLFTTFYRLASMAWRHGHAEGMAEGMRRVMDHVDGELGAMREGMR